MKKSNILFTIIGILILVSCSSEIDVPDNPLANPNQVKFSSTIGEVETRVTGTNWDDADEIGVYALNSGQALSEQGIFDGNANVKYATPGDGLFTATNDAIVFPESGNLDFIAYYPYKADISDYKFPINVSNQSNPSAIDVLYSNNAKGADKGNTTVSLTFKHKLAQLIFDITRGDGISSLNGLTSKIENTKVNGTMNLADGAVALGDTEGAITPVVTNNGNTATAKAIVVPGQNLNEMKILFNLDGKVYELNKEDLVLESGKKYTISIELSTTGIKTLSPSATIEDWEEGYTGTDDIILTPDDETTEPSEPSENLLFPGSDFEDWELFLSGLTTHGVKHIEQTNNGRNGSKALYINTTPGGNDFIFTAVVPEGFNPNGKDKIEFYIKGNAGKSLSVNVYKQEGSFAPYNLGTYSSEAELVPAGNNQYVGVLDTNGDWMKVTLDISSFDIITTPGESMFAIKVGKDAAYDLMIDDIELIGDGGTTEPEPELGDLLFAGGDFENWEAFVAGLNSFGLKDGYTSQSNDGRNGSKALALNGTPSGNDYAFTALVPEGFSASGKNAVEFYVKGTSAKSLSLNVYKTDGSYQAYNLGNYSAEAIVEPAANNQYNGSIDTGGKWMKVVLDISSLDIQTEVGKDIFALKVGKDADYDLLVDDFTITHNSNITEPDPDPDPDPELGNLLFPGSNFEDWGAFTGGLNSFGIITSVASQSNNGRDGSKALHISGTHSKNDYLFTAVVPEGFSTTGKSKIVFYIKGTSAKSLSLNVYVGKGSQMGTDYKCYNLGNYSAPATLEPKDSNAYVGSINTGGEWMKVTLDISSLTVNSTKGDNLFALKIGSAAEYDLLVDDITLE